MSIFGKLFGKKEDTTKENIAVSESVMQEELSGVAASQEVAPVESFVAEEAKESEEFHGVQQPEAEGSEQQTGEETKAQNDEAKAGVESAADAKVQKSKVRKSGENFRLKVLLKEMKENRSDVSTNMVIEEVVMNTHFVTPAYLLEKPEFNEDGTVVFTEEIKLRIPAMSDGEGGFFYTMFTDKEEYAQWTGTEKFECITLTFDNYVELIQENEDIAGVVLNPFSDNLVFTRINMLHLKTQKELKTRGVAVHTVTQDMQVMIGEPKEYPRELVEVLKRYLPGVPEVKKAWIRLMLKNNNPSLLLVADLSGNAVEIFKELAEVAKPYLKKMYIDMVSYKEDFGRNAVEGAEPFYEKE